MKLPRISKETIKEHAEAIKVAKKSKTFKAQSNRISKEILEENPELVDIILPTLESKKSKAYKSGYLAGFTTIYDILRKQAKKSK
ncbi:hypothetical protein KAT24_00570 [Candidatus Pacearchaeota archaeon]|nr:hypothetical protein [Candidatus Pacearchaeota archaeon]